MTSLPITVPGKAASQPVYWCAIWFSISWGETVISGTSQWKQNSLPRITGMTNYLSSVEIRRKYFLMCSSDTFFLSCFLMWFSVDLIKTSKENRKITGNSSQSFLLCAPHVQLPKHSMPLVVVLHICRTHLETPAGIHGFFPFITHRSAAQISSALINKAATEL